MVLNLTTNQMKIKRVEVKSLTVRGYLFKETYHGLRSRRFILKKH